ncbi:MAG: cytochrome c biogenesis protein CcdA [Planctomycetota bacterium]
MLLLLTLGAALPAARAQQMAHATLYTRVVGGHVQAAIQVRIEPTWHLYYKDLGGGVGLPTEVKLGGTGITWAEVHFPEPIQLLQPGAGDNGKDVTALGYQGTIVLYAQGELPAGSKGEDVEAEIKGQTCTDEGVCTLYAQKLTSSGAGSDELWQDYPKSFGAPPAASSEASSRAPGGSQGATAGRKPQDVTGNQDDLWGFLLWAVFWGCFALLMPCTYPMIPITISFFTKQASARGGKVLGLSLTDGLGIVLIFILIGVAFGSVIIPFATHPITNLVIGALFILFALSLFGAIELEPPQFLMRAASKASTTGGYLGVFLMGATLVITSFTCTAPFVGNLLSVGAQNGNLGRIVMGMGMFGLTMAVPFVLLALVPGRIQAMPRSGDWMHTLKVYLGFIEIAAALKFLSNVDLVWEWHVLSRELFLILWFGIFVAAAFYLFGIIRMHGDHAEVSPKRLSAALLTLLFGLYCGYGALGNDVDVIMTAIIPNYSNNRQAAAGTSVGKVDAPTIVVDDYQRAVAVAKETNKLVLVNFTGHT